MGLVLWAKWLNQPDDIPLAVYKTKKGKVNYVTGSKIAELLRKAVKEVRPNTTLDDLKRYSAHSLTRVWACVLLDESGKLPHYIKKRLRWLGDSFRMYLRDTAIIFFLRRFWLCHKKSCTPKTKQESLSIFLFARKSHQAPRSITVPVLLMVGIVRVHYLYLDPKICKYQFFSTDILYGSCRKWYAYQWF
jgi:hypothetical protein